jgi:beta-N-acetylhexosaminidase
MSIRGIIGQHFIIGIAGTRLTSEEKSFIIENNIGGVILMGRNCEDPRQIRDLCADIQSLRHKTKDKAPLFISIDMEGGRVHRLKPPFTQWPPLKKIGDLDAPTAAFHFTQKMGAEMMAIGINLDFAPCIDVFTNPKNTVIGDRAVSHDPHQVEKMASALVRGYIKSGIISCVKHFPGHGNTIVDSHEDLPVEEADLKRLHDVELIPFKKALRSRVELVMTSHILFKNIDSKNPVTFSEFFLKKMIREEFKYRGLIVTDDLDMKALLNNYERDQIPVKAMQAGAELLLYCNDPTSPKIAIEALISAVAQGQIAKSQLDQSFSRIMDLKKIKILQPDPRPLEEAMMVIGCDEHLQLAASLAKGEMPTSLLAE